jgi:hypothetical protein
MVGMQNEDAAYGPDSTDRSCTPRRHRSYVQEVRRIIEVIARIDEGLPIGIVGHGGDGRHLTSCGGAIAR